MKGVGRRKTQLLDDLRNRKRCWEQKEEAEDHSTSLQYFEIINSQDFDFHMDERHLHRFSINGDG